MESSLLDMPLVADILAKLRRDLPKNLCYHAAEHTEDVLEEALHFAAHDNLDKRQRELLTIAAAYHDAGFLDGSTETEARAAKMARDAMQLQGSYKSEEIDLVEQMILDTRLVRVGANYGQVASTFLSGYLLDGDLSNLGRDDFVEKLELVRREIGVDTRTFLNGTLLLMQGHQWYSPAAKVLRAAKKAENLIKLQQMMAADREQA